MNLVKTSILILIAMLAGLVLLSLQEPGWRESGGMPPSISPTNAARSAREKPALRHRVPDVRLEFETSQPVQASAAVSAEDRTPALDWVTQLYPELALIVATENLPSDMALAELQPMLSNAAPVVRLAALESLAEINHPALLPTLSAALNDPEPQVRIVALQALGSLDDPMAVSSIESCLFDRDTDVRLAAIEALANLEYEQATQTLAGLLSDPEARIRHQAVNALGEIGGEQAVAYLWQARVDPDADIRANAITILDELGETFVP